MPRRTVTLVIRSSGRLIDRRAWSRSASLLFSRVFLVVERLELFFEVFDASIHVID
jgi:hypothetical protein